MKFLPYIILTLFVCFGCGSTQDLPKGHDESVELSPVSGDQQVREEASHNRPVDIPTLLEVLELTDLEIIEFKKIYKNPETHLCLFVLNEIGANFVFLPRE